MRGLRPRGSRRHSLLYDYAESFGRDVVRRQSQLSLRAARADVELAYRARGEFLANMNHELRTPLNAVIGFTQMIRDGKSFGLTDEQINEYTSYILQSADLLLTHINTILELAAAESGGAKLSRRSCQGEEIVQHAFMAMEPLAAAANVKLVRKMDPSLPPLNVDPEMIEKALIHLIENAIQYSQDNSTVIIHVRRGLKDSMRDRLYFAVEDHGEGMTPAALQRAMHAFEQVHQGLDRRFEGTGLGLTVAKSFIEMNGGRFSLHSQAGKGTTVRFNFPISEQGNSVKAMPFAASA